MSGEVPGAEQGHERVRGALVVLAAGSGSRTGGEVNKVLVPVAGHPVLAWSLRRTDGASWCLRTVVVARADDLEEVRAVVAGHLGGPGRGRDVTVVTGGATRHGSEHAALLELAADIGGGGLDVVAIHDAARPLAAPALFDAVVAAAARDGAALPVLVRRDVLRGDDVAADVVSVQTPQAFAAVPLLEAYRRAEADGFTGTDTAACVERYTDLRVVGVPGSPHNLKVTFAPDLPVAAALLGRAQPT